MKLYILNTGYQELDKNWMVAMSTVGSADQHQVENKWIKIPIPAYLIETDDGYIVFDTGCNPEAMNGYWSNYLQKTYPLFQTEEQRLENQLALCGVKPEDVKTLILSHMHLDHAGNLQLFPHADIYVPKADYMNALVATHVTQDPEKHGAYVKGDLERPGNYILVDEEFEIAPGIEVINLPGHTEALLGLILHLDGGTYILPADCIYTRENYGPPVRFSGLVYDSIAFPKSIERVRSLQKKYNAKVIFSHDWDFFQTLDLAPKYYE